MSACPTIRGTAHALTDASVVDKVAQAMTAPITWSRQLTSRTPACSTRHVAVAARAETVESGLQMLRGGGNAVDAAVAMGFTAAVVEPTETSIGGSGFMLVHDASTRQCWSVEFPPRAPSAARAELFEPLDDDPAAGQLLGIVRVRSDANAIGYRAPGVPGVVAGLCLASERFGTLALEQLMEPAIALAADGFEVDAYYSLQTLGNLRELRDNPEAAGTLLADGLPPVSPFTVARASASRPRLRQANLAESLRLIAAHGSDPFYRGEIARAIDEDFKRNGGLLSASDLESYRASVERPLNCTYRGSRVHGPRAPCGSWTALQTLNVLDRLDPPAPEEDQAEQLHLVAEALRLAFYDRYRRLGDPDFAKVPLEDVLSDAYADRLASLIALDRVCTHFSELAGEPWRELAFDQASDSGATEATPRSGGRSVPSIETHQDVGHGTTHFCVVDREGSTVSCTMTAGNSFGSKVIAAGTGVLFDSAMSWFDPRPGAVNSIAPGKRPLVNMAPLLISRAGLPVLAVGASGGRRIISAVTQVVSGVLHSGLDITEALAAPRLDGSERVLRVNARVPAQVRDGLERIGHSLVSIDEEHEWCSYEFAQPAAIMLDESGRRCGAYDPSSHGFAAGAE